MQAKMQGVQDPSQRNIDNIRREASRHFRNKKKEYLKAKIEEIVTNSKIKYNWDSYRGISDFKKGYQPRTNKVKDEKGDLLADSHGILVTWSNHFHQILNVRGVNDVRQKYTLRDHQCLSRVPLGLSWLSKI